MQMYEPESVDHHELAIVEAGEVEKRRKDGWSLLGMADAEREAFGFTPPDYYQENATFNITTVAVRSPLFLMGRSEEGASLANRVAAAERAAKDAQHQAKTALKVKDDYERQRDEWRQSYNDSRERNDRLSEKLGAVKQMEADIAKIRAAIGDLRMREILESAG